MKKKKSLCYIWRACFQNLLHPLRNVTHLHRLPFANKIDYKIFKSHKICSYSGLLSFDVFHNEWKVIKSGNEWHAEVERRGFGIKQDFIPLFSLMYVYILWKGQKAVPTTADFKFVDIFYSKFKLAVTLIIIHMLLYVLSHINGMNPGAAIVTRPLQ